MRTSVASVAVCAALASTAIHPAYALDMTGTWTGKLTCKLFDGQKSSDKHDPSTMLVTQTGNTLAFDLDSGDIRYNGRAIPDIKKPNEKGQAVLIECGSDTDPAAGFDEIVRAQVKLKPSKGGGTFSAISIFQNGAAVGACKFKYKRTSTVDPNVGVCP